MSQMLMVYLLFLVKGKLSQVIASTYYARQTLLPLCYNMRKLCLHHCICFFASDVGKTHTPVNSEFCQFP